MKLILDTTLIDIVLKQWRSTAYDYSEVYNHSVFQELLAGAEDFQKKKITPEQYLHDLLHIDNIDMQQHQEEIERNLEIIKSVDFLKISKEVENFLPADICAQLGNVYVHPVIGIGGMAKSGFIAIDPAPCPWFTDDGTNVEKYLTEFLYPLLRHEAHHVACMHIRSYKTISQLHNLRDLSVDMVQEIQREGGAILCEKQCQTRVLSDYEFKRGREGICKCDAILQKWLKQEACEIDEEAWKAYYSLWGEEKLAYWLGEFICLMLIQFGFAQSVAECMGMEPLKMMELAKSAITHIRIEG